jgi:hypothetical protein
VFPFVVRQFTQALFSLSFAFDLLAPIRHKALDGIDPSRLRKDGLQIIKALVDESYVQTADMMEYEGEMRPMHYVSPNYVAKLYSYMNVYSEYAESPPDRDSFLRKMVHRSLPMAKRSPSLFQFQLLPLTHHLASLLPNPDTQPESHRNVCKLVTEIWTSYLLEIVQARPATASLALAPLNRHCNFDDCKQVNQFLQDSTQSRSEFRASAERRKHMETELRLVHGEAVSCHTIKTGKPHALDVIKQMDLVHGMELEAWNDRAKEAKEAFVECPKLVLGKVLESSFLTVLPEDSMRAIFGNSFDLLAAPANQTQAPQSTGTALTPVSGNASTTTTSAERKASDDGADMAQRQRIE